MNNDQVFFSDKNLTLLYNVVNRNVSNQTQYDLNSNNKYKKIFTKLCQKVHSATPNKNLDVLNKTVVEKTVPYLVNIVNKSNSSTQNNHTRNRNNNPMIRELENHGGMVQRPNVNIKMDYQSVSERLKNLQNERNAPSPQISSANNFADKFNSNDFEDPTKMYNRLLNERNNIPGLSNNNNTSNQNLNMSISQMDNSGNNTTDLNLLSYQDADLSGLTMSNISEDLGSNIDLNKNPQDLYDSQTNQRNQDENEYKSYFESQKKFQEQADRASALENKIITQRNNDNTELDKKFKEDSELFKPDLTDGRAFYKSDFENKEPTFKFQNPETATNKLIVENPFYDAYKKEIFEKKEYIQKIHYISINSRDRKWKDNFESRYRYGIQFQPEGTYGGGMSISKLFRNIVSIELVKAILPQDYLPLPYDNRLYMGIQSFPYLVLSLEEIEGLYHGTNENVDKSFAHLVFDKEYKCEVLTASQISNETTAVGTNSTPSNGVKIFDKQYSRGFMGYIPIGWEKKIFYPSPLASLNKLTINITNHEGESLGTMRDNLSVSNIEVVAIADLQLKKPSSFPKQNSQLIKITSTEYFTNRGFRIGDRIIIDDYVIDNPNSNQKSFMDFINRKNGHYIINLPTEVSSNNDASSNENEGFVNALYISPPGDYDDSNGGVKNTISSVTDGSITTTLSSSSTPKLLNLSLQNSFVLKIITRDFDTNSVMNIANA